VTYRAGIEFIDPDSMTLDEFCIRNVAEPSRAPSAA